MQDANYLCERFCQVSSSKWNHSLNTTLKTPLPHFPFLLCDIFSLENTFLCLDSPVGFLVIAAVVAGVSVMRNSETLNEQRVLSLLCCIERECRVLCFQARSFLRLCHHLQLSQDFLFRVHQCAATDCLERASLWADPDLGNVTTQISSRSLIGAVFSCPPVLLHTQVKTMFFKIPPQATPQRGCAVTDYVYSGVVLWPESLTEAGQNSKNNCRASINVSEREKTVA